MDSYIVIFISVLTLQLYVFDNQCEYLYAFSLFGIVYVATTRCVKRGSIVHDITWLIYMAGHATDEKQFTYHNIHI